MKHGGAETICIQGQIGGWHDRLLIHLRHHMQPSSSRGTSIISYLVGEPPWIPLQVDMVACFNRH